MTTTTIAQYCDTKGISYTTSADGLITIHGDLNLIGRTVELTGLDKIECIGGSLYLQDYAHAFTAEALTSIGGYLDLQDYAHADTFNIEGLSIDDSIYYQGEIFGKTFEILDGIPTIVLSEKKKDDVTIRHCQETTLKEGKFTGKKIFIASKGSQNAHGDTLKLALEELAFKTGDRDVSQWKGLPKDTKKTPSEWAFVYRMITGACQYGTSEFIKRQNLKKAYTLAEIIEATKGAYGHDRFKQIVEAA